MNQKKKNQGPYIILEENLSSSASHFTLVICLIINGQVTHDVSDAKSSKVLKKV